MSQNAKQRAAGSPNDQDKLYSYTSYDHLGRITEVGQMKNTSANGPMSDALSRNADLLNNWLLNLTNRREQVTQTIYDQPYPGFVGSPVPATVIAQRNLRNRVSYVSYTDNHLTSAFNQATFYTYDVLGNVDTLLQDYGCGTCGTQATYNMMNRNAKGRKKITYQYDLVSGKVNMMLYQNGWNDMWLHRYTYDAENRLVLVETSNDSLVWEKEARYEYYRHGPLARTVLGDQLVQGIDYAYTLQGWLKGVNSTVSTATHDMGGDGRTGSLNLFTARDALGFNLNYFGGDYTSINSTVTPFPQYYGIAGSLPDSMYRPLYNGNISSMATYFKRFQGAEEGLLNVYKYDQLNRLTRQDVYRNFNPTTNSYASLQASIKFRERVSYDANGNILTYQRNGDADIDAMMDDLTYQYIPGTNRLKQIDDKVAASRFGANSWDVIVDIDKQPDSNYAYDEIGNIIRDSAEKITSIKWNVYGKITEITRDALATDKNKTTRVQYTYDAAGNRIGKVEEKAGTTSKDYTWYARDAQGNIIAIYKASGSYGIDSLNSLDVRLSEQMVYGSSRLGMYGAGAGVDNPQNTGPVSRQFYNGGFFQRGRKQYELSNHLGNVLTTISDKKFGVSSGAIGSLIDYYEPDIVSAADYYPFGMVSRVGQTTTGVEYRFGFNGKENDKEAKDKFNQQDYGMRIYDPRVGRFLSVDPIAEKYPELTPYQFASNRPIQGIDLDGLEIIHYTVLFDDKGKGKLHFKGVQEREWGEWQKFSSVFGAKYKYSEASGDKVVGKKYAVWDKHGALRTRGIGLLSEDEFYRYVENNFHYSPEQKKEIEIKIAAGEVALGYAFSKFEGMYTKAPHLPETIISTNKQAAAATGTGEAARVNSSSQKTTANISVKLGGRTIVVDENLSPKIASQLQSQGYNVKTFPAGTLDADIITYANKAKAIVLTNNLKDFNKWGITTMKVSENMKAGSQVNTVIGAIENVNTKALQDPSVIAPGKNVSLAENKQ